jgi:hypothetical protein
MSARTRRHALTFLMFFSLSFASRAFAGAWSLAPGEYYTEIRGGWFSADDYHNQNGDKLFLTRGGLWEERKLVSYSEFGWKPRVSFILGIPIQSVTRRFEDTGVRPLPTQTGLGDGLIAFRYRLASGRRAAAIQLDWKAPFGYERDRFLLHADSVAAGDTNGDGDSLDLNAARQLGQPVLGDGQQDVTASLWLGTAVPRGFLEFGGGYRYRFEEPQDQIVVGADLGLWLTRSLMLAGRYEGVLAAGESARPTADPEYHRVGPTLVYRVTEFMDLFAASMHTAKATNALHTDEIVVGFAFRRTKLDRLQGFLGGTAGP